MADQNLDCKHDIVPMKYNLNYETAMKNHAARQFLRFIASSFYLLPSGYSSKCALVKWTGRDVGYPGRLAHVCCQEQANKSIANCRQVTV